MNKDSKIIIGSGLAGPLLAIYLAQRGYSVDLYEKRPDLRIENISVGKSINLALSHRGIKALQSADVYDQIEPLLIPMKGRLIHLSSGEISFQPYSIHSHEHINSISRGELNKILMTKAEESEKVQIHFEHSLSTIDESNNELVFENGNRATILGHIIGADGSGSVVRAYIDMKVQSPSYTKPLGHNYKELHIAPGKDGNFQLDPNALHIWPRGKFMLIALPNMDKSFTCTLFLPVDGSISFNELSTPKSVIDFFSEYFGELLPMLDNFPNIFFENPIGKLATVYAEQWQHDNQFCLVGDAAHAVVPFFGQGMNASFEDCEVLMECLDEAHGNWKTVCEKYSIIRKPDGYAIADMAIENYVEMRDLVARKEFIQEKNTANILWERFPNRFIPRYNMVSFTSIPYSEVYRRGELQKKIIKNINPTNPDMKLAEELIIEKLNPIL
jgi:kynurenine 3-monooxygenase